MGHIPGPHSWLRSSLTTNPPQGGTSGPGCHVPLRGDPEKRAPDAATGSTICHRWLTGLEQLLAAGPGQVMGTCCKGKSQRGWAGRGASKGPRRRGSCPPGKGRQSKAVHRETEGTRHPVKILGTRPFSTSPAQTLPYSISCVASATRDAMRFVPNQLCSHYTASKEGFSALAGLR